MYEPAEPSSSRNPYSWKPYGSWKEIIGEYGFRILDEFVNTPGVREKCDARIMFYAARWKEMYITGCTSGDTQVADALNKYGAMTFASFGASSMIADSEMAEMLTRAAIAKSEEVKHFVTVIAPGLNQTFGGYHILTGNPPFDFSGLVKNGVNWAEAYVKLARCLDPDSVDRVLDEFRV